MARNVLILFICMLVAAFCTGEEATCDGITTPDSDYLLPEKRLLRCLLADYEKDVRPAMKQTDVVNITLDMVLLQIVKLDEKNRILDLNGWIHKEWMDPQLKWDPAKFGGVKLMRIPADRIWLPDIVLLNNAELSNTYVMDKLVVVQNTGKVTWVPHARFRAFCGLQMRKFPFDEQTCSLLFGSWTYDSTKLDLQLPPKENISKNYFWDGKEWDITKFEVVRKMYPYTAMKDNKADSSQFGYYPYIQYRISIKRVSLFYGTMLVAPVILMAILTIFMFIVPPEAYERLTLGVGILISLSLQTMVIDDYVPTEIDTMPIIFMYILFDFIMVTFAIVISLTVLNFHHRDTRKGKVPNWMREIVLGKIRKLLCMKEEPYSALSTEAAFSDLTSELTLNPSQRARDMENANTPLPKSPTMALEKVLDEIRLYLRELASKDRTIVTDAVPSHRQLVVNEWHQVAHVLDRLSFLLYTITTVLVTIAICSHG